MTDAIIPPLALHGWYMLTQFVDVVPHADHRHADDLARTLSEWEDLGEEGWSGVYRMIGGGSHLMLLHLRPRLEDLGEVERTLRLHPSSADLVVTGGYLSVVELGLYGHTLGLARRAEADGVPLGSDEWKARVEAFVGEQLEKPYTLGRLYPRQPDDMPYVCFYPMDKRRAVGQNWYTLPLAERARLMQEHGSTGRAYAGKVSQIISGSVGFDDWEWAVTLFAADPIHFKDLVTEMRYDKVTSVYGEFGSFRVGHRISGDRVAAEVKGE